MLLSILLIVLLALIALFHFTQGLFAATVSAFCAGIAALMAFSYHETIVATYAAENLGPYGSPLALVVIFAVAYLLLRFITDNLLPGNVRYPVGLDRVGAPIMGLIAGFFATAIIAIAAQELPFGPTVMWYAPYETEDQTYIVERRLASLYRIPMGEDASNYGQLTIARFGTDEAEEARRSLWVPVDEWFLALVGKLSDKGSLAGPAEANFNDIYPDFRTAIFGQRLGMQRSATQVAFNLNDTKQFTVDKVFLVNTEGANAQYPGGIPQVQGDLGRGREVERVLKPRAGKTLIVVRAGFTPEMSDQGDYVRFSPGTARLVIAGRQYFPIATLESATVAVNHKPDDYLMARNGADLIYEVDSDSALSDGKLPADAFIEFKEFARVDLGGTSLVTSGVTKDARTHVLRKLPVIEFISTRLAGTDANTQEGTTGFESLRASVPELGEETTPDTSTEPSTGASDKEQPQGQSPMDIIRQESGRRNQALNGDDDEDANGDGGQ